MSDERRMRSAADVHIKEVLDKALAELLHLAPKVETLESSVVDLNESVKLAASTGQENTRKIHMLRVIIYLSIIGLIANLTALIGWLIPAANDAKNASHTLNDCLIASKNPESCYQRLAKQGTSGTVRNFSFSKCWGSVAPELRTAKLFDDCASLILEQPIKLVDPSPIIGGD